MTVAGTGGRRAHWEASRTALRLRWLGLVECRRFDGNRAANRIDALLRLLGHVLGDGVDIDGGEAGDRWLRRVATGRTTVWLRSRLRLRGLCIRRFRLRRLRICRRMLGARMGVGRMLGW